MILNPCLHTLCSTRYYYGYATSYRTAYSSRFDCCTGYRSCGSQRCCRKPIIMYAVSHTCVKPVWYFCLLHIVQIFAAQAVSPICWCVVAIYYFFFLHFIAVCSPSCQSWKVCSAPNQCTCRRPGYIGYSCQTRKLHTIRLHAFFNNNNNFAYMHGCNNSKLLTCVYP